MNLFNIHYLILAVIFSNLDKSKVLMECRVFNESPLNPRRCYLTLMKLFYLLYSGKTLSETEATSVFFSVTKAFQSKDVQIFAINFILS